MSEAYAIQFARRKVADYADDIESVMRSHYEAMDCYECETLLQAGIEAFRWLVWADELIRKAVYAEQLEFTKDIEEIFPVMFKAWLKPCPDAEKWIALQQKRGFKLDNLDEFQRCCEEVRAVVDSFENNDLPIAMADLQNQAIAEHRDGQTTEFV